MNAIEISHLTKIYEGSSAAEKALSDVSVCFSHGEKVLIQGESGSGKSTFLKIIAGEEMPTYGNLAISSKPLYVGSDAWILDEYSVFDNIYYWLLGRGIKRKEAKSLTLESLQAAGLEAMKKKKAKNLSGGERNRIGIARAISLKPEIALFDEITANLDPEATKEMLSLLLDRLPNTLILFATHDPESFSSVSTRSLHLKDGKIDYDSAPLSNEETINESPEKEHVSKQVLNGISFGGKALLKKRLAATLFALFSATIGFSSGSSLIIGEKVIRSESNISANYYYNANFANRLVATGAHDFHHASYLDAGSLISDEVFSLHLSNSSMSGYALVRNSYIQPIKPFDSKLIAGKESDDSLYLCVPSKSDSDDIARYAEFIGEEFQLLHSSQWMPDEPLYEKIRFGGIYQISENSFFKGPHYSIYLPPKILENVSKYCLSLIEKSAEQKIPPAKFSGLRGYNECYAVSNGSRLKKISSEEWIKRHKGADALKKLYLSPEMNGKKATLNMLGYQLPISAIPEIGYSNLLLPGEWTWSEWAFKKFAVQANCFSSAFYETQKMLLEDIEPGKTERADIYTVSGKIDPLFLAISGFASLLCAALVYWASLGITTIERKKLNEHAHIGEMMGFRHEWVKLPFSILNFALCFIAYALSFLVFENVPISTPAIIITLVLSSFFAASIPHRKGKS